MPASLDYRSLLSQYPNSRGLKRVQEFRVMAASNREALAQLTHQICNSLTQIMIASNLLQLDLQETLSTDQTRQFKGIDEGAEQIRILLGRLRRMTEADALASKPQKNETPSSTKYIDMA
jgi:signal transduction histidine kinase